MGTDRQQMNDELDWLCTNLKYLEQNYDGKWVAIVGKGVAAASIDLSDLLHQVRASRINDSLITQIVSAGVLWRTAYASQGVRREYIPPFIQN